MAAPSVTARSSPTGKKLRDGYRSVLAFARLPACNIWEKEVGTPGMDGGDPIDQTTMHNLVVVTKAAQALVDFTDFTVKCAYDPNVYTQIMNSLLNEPGAITRHFSDLSTLSFYGYINKVDFDPLVRGTQPELSINVVVTNEDPVTQAEERPVLVEVVGT